MEQMMECLLAKMDSNHEEMKTSQDEMKAVMKACLDETMAYPERMKADQEELEAIQEKTECVKATHMFTALQGWASSVLRGDRKQATYEETIGALEG
jgi:hypothetical protein